jgi:hypothetical protein
MLPMLGRVIELLLFSSIETAALTRSVAAATAIISRIVFFRLRGRLPVDGVVSCWVKVISLLNGARLNYAGFGDIKTSRGLVLTVLFERVLGRA